MVSIYQYDDTGQQIELKRGTNCVKPLKNLAIQDVHHLRVKLKEKAIQNN